MLWGQSIVIDGTSAGKIECSSITRDGLVGLWLTASKDASGTTIYDKSGQENNGTSANTPVWTTDQAGSGSRAMVWDGSTDYITFGSTITFTTGQTLVFWVWRNNSDNIYHLIGNNSTGISYLRCHDNEVLVTAESDTNGDSQSITVSGNTINAWHQIGFVYQSADSKMAVYLDGSYQNTSTNAYIDDFTFNYISRARTLDGKFSDITYYNKELTAEEFTANYNAGRTGTSDIPQSSLMKGLVFDMPLTSGWTQSATVLSDKSAYDLHGTVTGATVGSSYTTFDGNNQVITSSTSNAINNSTKGTFAVWIYWDSSASGDNIIMVVSDNSLSDYYYLSISDGKLKGKDRTVNVYKWELLSNDVIITKDTWHHVALVQDGTEPKLYHNGELATSTFVIEVDKTTWISDIAATTIEIGSIQTWNEFLGNITQCKIWNRDLSVAEIANLYSQGRN